MSALLVTTEEVTAIFSALESNANLAFFLQAVSDAIHTELDRERLAKDDVANERIPYCGQSRITLQEYPVDIDNVELSIDGDTINPSTYEVQKNGIIEFFEIPAWSSINARIVGNYPAGYDPVPSNLKLAAIMGVNDAILSAARSNNQTAQAINDGSEGVTKRIKIEDFEQEYFDSSVATKAAAGNAESLAVALSPTVLALIAPYRRVNSR